MTCGRGPRRVVRWFDLPFPWIVRIGDDLQLLRREVPRIAREAPGDGEAMKRALGPVFGPMDGPEFPFFAKWGEERPWDWKERMLQWESKRCCQDS